MDAVSFQCFHGEVPPLPRKIALLIPREIKLLPSKRSPLPWKDYISPIELVEVLEASRSRSLQLPWE